jgi:tetratricopeptide (TPR) repeat protein
MLRRLVQLAAAVLLVLATTRAASSLPGPGDAPYDIDIIPSSRVLRWASLGHPTLVANLYYLRAVQYIGDPHANRRGWDKLYPVLDLVTELDPAHGYAYQVGGTILGSAHRVAESNALLEKGMRNVPTRYILPYLRAFNAFYYDGDFASAGRFVEHAARIPGAPEHLRQSALAMYVKGHRADAALRFLRSVRAQTHDPESLKAIDRQIEQAELELAAEPLDDAVAAYRARYGLPPLTVHVLVHAGLLESLPADPFGGSWVIGSDGRVHSSVSPYRFARPDQMPAGREPGVDLAKLRGQVR